MKNKLIKRFLMASVLLAFLLSFGSNATRINAEEYLDKNPTTSFGTGLVEGLVKKQVSNEEYERILVSNSGETGVLYETTVTGSSKLLDNLFKSDGSKAKQSKATVSLKLGFTNLSATHGNINRNPGNHYSQATMFFLDGDIAFCVEPGVEAAYGMTITWNTSTYSNDLVNRIANHTKRLMYESKDATVDGDIYLSGQGYIWENLSSSTSFSTDKRNTQVQNQYKVLKDRVVEHFIVPSFNNGSYSVKEGTSATIKDSKGQFAKYFTTLNEATVESATGMTISISGNNVTITNPKGNKKTASANLSFEKYKGWFEKGVSVIYTNSTWQNMAVSRQNDPVEGYFTVRSLPIVPGSIEITKWMDGNAIYGSAVKGAKPMYDTKDTVQRYYSNYTNKIVSYPTKEEFQTQDLYSKPIVYDAIKDEPVMKTVDKLDENGEKIPVLDQEGNPELDQQGNTIYETETIQDTLSDGTPVYHALQDDQGNYIYEKITSNKIYPTLIEMENDYPAGADVKFGLYDVTKSKLLEEQGASEGLIRYLNLTPNTYWVKETATQNGFVISTEWYQVVVNEGQVTKVKNGNKIWNYQEQANFYLKKTDELGNPIENIPYIFYKKLNGSCDMSKAIATKYTDSKGEIFVSGLPGNYCYQEGNSKYGYLIDPIVYEFTAKNNETVEHTRVNKYLNIKLQLLKLNQDKLPLKDAKFNVSFADTVFMTDEEGKIVLDENGNKTVLEENLTDITTGVTNENGILELDFNMDTKYYNDSNGRPRLIKLHEIEAPTGYQLLQAPIYGYIIYVDGEFKFVSEIDDSYVIPTHILENEVTDTVANVEIENKLITNKITISKVDITNNKELPGAKICINRMSDDAVVECWISSEVQRETEITAYLDNNMCGEFYAVEEMAPEGYYRTTIVFPFKVCEQGVEQKFVIENTPIPIPLPQTGLNILVNIELILAALIVSTVTHVIIRKKVN